MNNNHLIEEFNEDWEDDDEINDDEDQPSLEDLIEEHRYWNVEDFDWWEFVFEDWKEKLEALGYEDPKIQFSGFWSHSDGAGFESGYDIDKFINNNKPLIIQWLFPKITDGIDDLKNCLSIYIKHTGGNCCRENCFRVNVDIECDPDYIEDDKFEDIVQQLEKMLEDERESLSHEIYKSLEAEYYYLTSDEAVKESLIANELWQEPEDEVETELEAEKLAA